jgi:hypothetical protein
MDTILNTLTLGLDQLLGRLSGPLNFRLVVMPTVVTVLALRAAWKDHREGRPAFLGIWIQDPVERNRVFRGALRIRRIFLVAVVITTTYQLMVFGGLPRMVLVVAVLSPCALRHPGPLYLLVHFLSARPRGGSFRNRNQMKLKTGSARRVRRNCALPLSADSAFVGVGRAHGRTSRQQRFLWARHYRDRSKLARELEWTSARSTAAASG